MRTFLLVLAIFLAAYPQKNGKIILYEIDGKMYEGYYASPSPGAALVLIVHDWDGLTEYGKKRADMLYRAGYAVFAVDLFGRGIRPVKTDERRKLTGELYADREKMRALLEGGLQAAQANGADIKNAVAAGYCFGGTCVLELARSGAALKGFASFHGGLALPDGQDYSGVMGRIIIFHGSADESVSMKEFADLAENLEAHRVPHEMIVYGGAPHAFTVFGSERYREDADRKSWERFLRFLDETLR